MEEVDTTRELLDDVFKRMEDGEPLSEITEDEDFALPEDFDAKWARRYAEGRAETAHSTKFMFSEFWSYVAGHIRALIAETKDNLDESVREWVDAHPDCHEKPADDDYYSVEEMIGGLLENHFPDALDRMDHTIIHNGLTIVGWNLGDLFITDYAPHQYQNVLTDVQRIDGENDDKFEKIEKRWEEIIAKFAD